MMKNPLRYLVRASQHYENLLRTISVLLVLGAVGILHYPSPVFSPSMSLWIFIGFLGGAITLLAPGIIGAFLFSGPLFFADTPEERPGKASFARPDPLAGHLPERGTPLPSAEEVVRAVVKS